MADVDFLGYARAAQQQQGNPVKDFIQGYGAVGDLRNQVMRGNLLGLELEKAQRQQEALKGYGQTGDIQGVMQKDPMLGLKLTEQQFNIANAVSKYWDNTKAGLTKETYGPWRADLLKKFLGINPSQFPDPSTFKTDEDFTKFKYEKELKNAQFEALKNPKGVEWFNTPQGPRPYHAGSLVMPPPGATTAKEGNSFDEKAYQQWVKNNPGKSRLDFEKEKKTILTEPQTLYPLSGKGPPILYNPREGNPPPEGYAPAAQALKTPKPFDKFEAEYLAKNPKATKKEIILEYNKTVYAGRAAGQATKPLTPKQKADAAVAEQKAKLIQKLGGGDETPTTKPAPTEDYYQSFKNALNGPNKKTAIERAQQLYPDYIERAKKEGLL